MRKNAGCSQDLGERNILVAKEVYLKMQVYRCIFCKIQNILVKNFEFMHDEISNPAFVQNHGLSENKQNSTETQKIIVDGKNVY